jgi:hypothetical protein
MSRDSKKGDERLPSQVVIHADGQRVETDSTGVSTFYLPPSRCKNCND